MTFQEINALLELVDRLQLAEFKMKNGEFELIVRTKEYNKAVVHPAPAPTVIPIPQVSPAIQPISETVTPSVKPVVVESPAPIETKKSYLEVRSPIVGTFYRSGGPDKPPFVKVGDTIKAGDVVCIIEAMKLFNEIESDVSGTIVKVLINDAQPVEYDQLLFLVEA